MPTRANSGSTSTTLWDHQVPFEGSDPIDGVAIGDALMDREGLETVFVSRDGGTYLTYYDQTREQWHTEKIHTSEGQQLTPAIGDLRPDIPGNEIMVVGLSSGTEDVKPGEGTATVLHRAGSKWIPERVYTDPMLIHGCDIGDLDHTIPGNEAVVVTFSWKAVMIWYDEDTKRWNSSEIYTDSHNVRKVVIADLLPDTIHPGNEMVAVSKAGNVTLAFGDHNNWTVRTIYDEEPGARICVGDIDGDGELEVFVGTDTFKVIGLKRDQDTWIAQTVFEDSDKNRGVWVGDVDPNIPGSELYAFGYSRNLTQISGSFGGGWNHRTLFTDTMRGHEIRIGDVMPDVPGPEIAVVGYSSALRVIYYLGDRETMVPTLSSEESIYLSSGDTETLSVTVAGDCVMGMDFDPVDGIDIEVIPSSIYLAGTFTITLTAEPTGTTSNHTLNMYLRWYGGEVDHHVSIRVLGDTAGPSISAVYNSTGSELVSEADVAMAEVIRIEMSEPITEGSFLSSLSLGMIYIMRGDHIVTGASFELIDDGTAILLDLNESVVPGRVTVHIEGLRDAVGNEMDAWDLELEVKGEDATDPTASLIVLIAVFATLIALAVVFISIYLRRSREGSDEEEVKEEEGGESPKVPRQI